MIPSPSAPRKRAAFVDTGSTMSNSDFLRFAPRARFTRVPFKTIHPSALGLSDSVPSSSKDMDEDSSVESDFESMVDSVQRGLVENSKSSEASSYENLLLDTDYSDDEMVLGDKRSKTKETESVKSVTTKAAKPDAEITSSNIATSSLTKEDFDFEFGDMLIKVSIAGKGIIKANVSSSAMAVASVVWKKFIFPPFPQLRDAEQKQEDSITLESENNGTRKGRALKKQCHSSLAGMEIDFTEDDPDALLVLLRIAHLKFKMVPPSPSFKLLLHLAILCDQYDCVNLVQPWYKDWFATEETECVKLGQENWLFISWVFGRQKAFEKVAKNIVKEIILEGGEAGPWLDQHIEHIIPQGLTERILDVRLATLDKLLDIPYGHLERYDQTKTLLCKDRHVGGAKERKRCDMVTHGSIYRGLRMMDMMPRPKAADISISVANLASRLSDLEILAATDYCHENCFNRKAMVKIINGIVEEMETPLLDSHRKHFSA